MQHFTKLVVWQRSHKLVLALYRASVGFPAHERYGLTSQLRRAALSVPTNVAEGSKRASRDLGYIEAAAATRYLQEITEIARMLASLRSKIVRDI